MGTAVFLNEGAQGWRRAPDTDPKTAFGQSIAVGDFDADGIRDEMEARGPMKLAEVLEAQKAMIAIARGITRFDGRAAFSTWCYRIATNAALDELRRARRRPVPTHPDAPEPVAPGTGPDDVVAARLDVDEALWHVPEEFRAAVVLRDLCDLDYAEIAEVLDIPAGTVRSRISRGRAILVERLGRGDEPGNPTAPPERQTTDG